MPPPRSSNRAPRPGATIVDHNGQILGPVDVERAIMETSEAMGVLRDGLLEQARAAAGAEHAWKVARAKARTDKRFRGGEGPGGRATESECDDYAITTSEPQHLEYLMTEAVLTASREAVRLTVSQMDGLRSVNANIRGQT